jgi:hypothetical protein
MPALSIEFFLVSRSFTFWQILGVNEANLANAGSGSHGLFAFAGVLSIAAPFAKPFVQHPQSRWLNAAPLGYLVLAAVALLWRISRGSGSSGVDPELAQGVAREVASAMWDALSLGAGAYLLVAAAAFLAFKAIKSRA